MRKRMSHVSVRSAARLSVTAGLAGILLAAGAPIAAFAEPESDLDSARSQLEQIGSEVSDLQDDLAKQTDKLNQTEYEIGEKAYVAVLDMPAVLPFASFDRKYTGIAKYPAVTRDLSMVVPKNILVGEIEAMIEQRAGKILEDLTLFDVYEGAQILAGHKSVAYSITFRAKDHTLEEKEVASVMNKILNGLKSMGIELRA